MDLDAIFNQAHNIGSGSSTEPTQPTSNTLDLDAIFNQAHQPTQQLIPTPEPQIPLSPIEALGGGAGNLLNGLLMNYGDETVGYGSGSLSYLFNNPENKSFDTLVGERTALSESLRNRVKEQHPILGNIAEIGGVIGNPLSALTAAKGAGFLSRLAQNTGLGVAGGALYGGGENQDRLQNAGKGALLGGLFGAGGEVVATGVGKAANTGLDYLATKGITVDNLIDDFRFNAGKAQQRGALGGENPGLTVYSPAEIMFAKRTKDIPLDQFTIGRSELSDAIDSNIPLFAPEALNSPSVYRSAKQIANTEAALEYSQNAINQRAMDAPERLTKLFDSINPERSVFEGAEKFSTGANDIVEAAINERKAKAAPWYKAAFEGSPTIESEEIAGLIAKDKNLNSAIKQVKSFGPNADLPENSLEVLHQAKGILDDKIEVAKRAGNKNEQRLLTDTRSKLNDTLREQNPLYAMANDIFSNSSKDIDAIPKDILKIGKFGSDVGKVGQLLKKTPEEISVLRSAYENGGKLDEFTAGVRAHLQDIVDSTKDGRNSLTNIIGSKAQREKLAAALGVDPKAITKDSLLKILDTEQKIAAGKARYTRGSDTADNLAEDASFREAAGFFGKIKNGNYVDAAIELFTPKPSDKTAQELAEIYFNPTRGRDALSKILPLKEAFGKNQNISEVFRSGVSSSSRPGTAATISGMSEPSFKPSSKASEPFTLPTQGPTVMPKADDIDLNAVPKKKADRVAFIESQIDSDPIDAAIYEIESGRNPNAKNPTSSASGAFQLINKTAKKLGVTDVFDIAENYKGYLKLKEENQGVLKRLGIDPNDAEALYSLHYLGAPTFRKLINGQPLTETQAAQVRYLESKVLPKFNKVYKSKLVNV